ncbi:outer membrane protein [Yoonia litorea]|uniref:Opacity protein n=1 Tax=Yoonia litorea TaxID=1123755 RepID=A0A1I6MZT2_9RHOB|nr:outer membrane beta-barrel protein [Yoonia litorea]SFS21199.1 Opacity protein [Yoonia litorea]
MTMRKALLASAIAMPVAFAGTTTFAGGMAEAVVVPAPVVAPVAPVASNDWTGFYAGGQVGYGQLDNDALDDDTNGALYGLHAGYLYDLGSFVVGGEIDADATTIESASPGDGVELDSVARAKLRLGYDAGDWMPYVVAGAMTATTSGAVDGDGTGGFAGVGIDYQWSDNMRIGWEVLQHQFEDFADTDGLDIDATTATLRASFKF